MAKNYAMTAIRRSLERLTQTGVMDKSTPSGLIYRQRCWHVGHVAVGILCPIAILRLQAYGAS